MYEHFDKIPRLFRKLILDFEGPYNQDFFFKCHKIIIFNLDAPDFKSKK